ncbi:hypothetical protein QE357_004402 [Siphonobacter sp. BAB-5404]|nr:hypothetical protein [Siphonobacter sp. SORGH_AS_0500]
MVCEAVKLKHYLMGCLPSIRTSSSGFKEANLSKPQPQLFNVLKVWAE